MPVPFAVIQNWGHFTQGLIAAAAFGVLGIALLVVGFKVFEMFTPKVDVEQELAKGNVAVGITVGALLVGISLIVVMALAPSPPVAP
jgi:putative membrane protein